MDVTSYEMSKKNLSAVLRKSKDLVLETTEVPEPSAGQVQIRMKNVGICGSDVHYWVHGRIGDTFVVRKPMILGHESSGIVSNVGEGVRHLKVGDKVAIEPGVPCRQCHHCLSGRYNLCPDVNFLATPPHNGSLRKYHVHDALFCYKLPENVTLEEAALLEPFAVGVHACRRSSVKLGDRILICGAGPIGLVTMLAACAAGAVYIAITDINDGRLNVAKSMGADITINAKSKTSVEELANEIKTHFPDRGGPDKTFECSGVEESVQIGCLATRSGGVFTLIGLGMRESLSIPLIAAARKEGGTILGVDRIYWKILFINRSFVQLNSEKFWLSQTDIRGVFRYANCYPIALSLVASKKVNLKPLITHRFDMTDTLKAFETARDQKDGAIKVMINCD